jgi:hypothetical protein
MKKIIIVTLYILLCTIIYAQENKSESRIAGDYKLDFAISDAPAFKILGKEPSDLFRPSSSDVVSFIVSNLLNPSDLTIPNSYAAEVSPALLIDKNLTLTGYRENYFLYNLRLSFGTTKDSKSGKYNLGVGLRSTIIDNSDLRKDKGYLDSIFKIMDNREFYRTKLGDDFWKIDSNHIYDTIAQKRYAKYDKAEMKKYDDDNNKVFEALLEIYKKKNWNKEKFEIALAMLGSSNDSLVKNVEISKCALWSTLSYPLSTWGQVLFGGNLNYNALSDKGSGSLASRIYGGTNSIKGFIEAQYKTDNNDKSKNWLISFGAELNMINNIWVNYYAGYEVNKINSENKSEFVSHFDLRFALK